MKCQDQRPKSQIEIFHFPEEVEDITGGSSSRGVTDSKPIRSYSLLDHSSLHSPPSEQWQPPLSLALLLSPSLAFFPPPSNHKLNNQTSKSQVGMLQFAEEVEDITGGSAKELQIEAKLNSIEEVLRTPPCIYTLHPTP